MKRLVFFRSPNIPKTLTRLHYSECVEDALTEARNMHTHSINYSYTVHCRNGHDFPLVFRSNYSPVSYRFRYKW